jgi:hypothetical protein
MNVLRKFALPRLFALATLAPGMTACAKPFVAGPIPMGPDCPPTAFETNPQDAFGPSRVETAKWVQYGTASLAPGRYQVKLCGGRVTDIPRGKTMAHRRPSVDVELDVRPDGQTRWRARGIQDKWKKVQLFELGRSLPESGWTIELRRSYEDPGRLYLRLWDCDCSFAKGRAVVQEWNGPFEPTPSQ